MEASMRLVAESDEDGINGNQSEMGLQQAKIGSSYFSGDDSSGFSSFSTSDNTAPTHRVQFAFVPRHHDELLLDIGDAVHVYRQYDDHWCQDVMTDERDTFYLTMLASIEVGHHKGNDVLVQAINKVLNTYKSKEEILIPQTVLMEVSFRGLHVIDKRKKNFFKCPTFDFFYSLQNISFCGAHPKQLRYFGFISKHPLLPRFACHVFLSNESTQPIVESIGRAFKRSYDEYMAFAHPTEDIYLE